MAFEGEDAQRWVLTDAPALAPGVDFITKSPNGPFIDTGLNVTFEMRGRLYLSVETIEEMAKVAGLLEAKNNGEQELHEKAIYNAGYKAGIESAGELSEQLAAIGNTIGFTWDAVHAPIPTAKDAVPSEVPAGSDSTNVREPAVGSGSKGRKTSAATSKRGPNDVPSTGDDAERFRI